MLGNVGLMCYDVGHFRLINIVGDMSGCMPLSPSYGKLLFIRMAMVRNPMDSNRLLNSLSVLWLFLHVDVLHLAILCDCLRLAMFGEFGLGSVVE